MEIQDMRKYKLPDSPGVYFFENEGGVMYIGRATSLQNRVRSYFRDDILKTRGKLIADMVSRARTLRWQKTPSVLETVIAEANLIKKFQPPYNTEEKDDKSFNYLVITREDYPRVVTVRGKDLKERYPKSSVKHAFGPYPNGEDREENNALPRWEMPPPAGQALSTSSGQALL